MGRTGFFGRYGMRVQSALSGLGATAVVYPAAFLTALGEGILSLGIIFLMRETYAASPSLIGWLMSSGTLVYVIGCLFVRPLFSGLRPRFLMLTAAGGIAVSLGLLYALRQVPLTFLFYGMSKLSASFFWPPAMGWLTENREGKSLNRTLSRFNMSWSLGVLVSPTLAGWLSEPHPEYAVLGTIAVQTASFLLIAGAALALPAARRGESAGRHPAGVSDRGEHPDRSTPLRFTGWVGMFAGWVSVAAIVTLFPQYARDALGASKTMVGHLLSLRMVVRVASFFLLGTVSFWHHRGRYQLAASVLLMAAMLAMSRLRTLAPFAVLIPVVALGNSFVYTGSLFHGVAGSSNRAARMAIQEALMSGGYILGASVGGLLYQHASFQAALLFCALLLLAALAAQIAILAGIRTGFGRGVRRKSLL